MNPIYLNYSLIVAYAVLSVAWLLHGNQPQSLYWFGAFIITVAVTWGLK